MLFEPQRICLGVPHSIQISEVPRLSLNLATFVPRVGAGVFIKPRESLILIFGGGEV